MNEYERVWLRELWSCHNSGTPIDFRAMMVKLRDQLPAGFAPADVDRAYTDGTHLTVAAIKELDPASSQLKDLERLILHIKAILIKDPHHSTITSMECASALRMEEVHAARLLGLMSTLGSYWTVASGNSEGTGYSEVRIESDKTFSNYLRFTTLEDALRLQDRSRDEKARRRQGVTASLRDSFARSIESDFEFDPVQLAVRANTAFILMSMNPQDASLEDVSNGIKDTCARFGIEAKRVDDFEHADRITDFILQMIRRSELLIADVSGERPNVYYEIGFAHALSKRPILYRRAGTRLHFDLSVHNVPEYSNVSDLKAKLVRRLEEVLGRSPAVPSGP